MVQVYGGSGWRLSTDHVQFALGRLAGALRRGGEAARWLAMPLAPHSPQPQPQHRAFLRDYMQAHQVTYPPDYRVSERAVRD